MGTLSVGDDRTRSGVGGGSGILGGEYDAATPVGEVSVRRPTAWMTGECGTKAGLPDRELALAGYVNTSYTAALGTLALGVATTAGLGVASPPEDLTDRHWRCGEGPALGEADRRE